MEEKETGLNERELEEILEMAGMRRKKPEQCAR